MKTNKIYHIEIDDNDIEDLLISGTIHFTIDNMNYILTKGL